MGRRGGHPPLRHGTRGRTSQLLPALVLVYRMGLRAFGDFGAGVAWRPHQHPHFAMGRSFVSDPPEADSDDSGDAPDDPQSVARTLASLADKKKEARAEKRKSKPSAPARRVDKRQKAAMAVPDSDDEVEITGHGAAAAAPSPTEEDDAVGPLPSLGCPLGCSLPRLPVGWRGLVRGLCAYPPMVVRPGSTQLSGFEVRFLVSGPAARGHAPPAAGCRPRAEPSPPARCHRRRRRDAATPRRRRLLHRRRRRR